MDALLFLFPFLTAIGSELAEIHPGQYVGMLFYCRIQGREKNPSLTQPYHPSECFFSPVRCFFAFFRGRGSLIFAADGEKAE